MINISQDTEWNGWERWNVWTDCEEGSWHDGRCIGLGSTKREALEKAKKELESDLEQIKAQLA